jgi:hypothetical protein
LSKAVSHFDLLVNLRCATVVKKRALGRRPHMLHMIESPRLLPNLYVEVMVCSTIHLTYISTYSGNLSHESG